MIRFHRACRLAVIAFLANAISCASDATEPRLQDLVNSVVLNLGLSTMTVGQTVQAEAIARNFSGSALTGVTITWSSSNTSVATVTSSGLVSALTPGQTDISASAAGQSAKVALTVTPVPVANVTVALSATSVLLGQVVNAVATVRDAANVVLTQRNIEWSSSNMTVAIVSPTGSVTTLGPGTTNIVATSEGKTGSAALTVRVGVGSVIVALASAKLQPQKTTTATAIVRDASNNVLAGRPVNWATSDITIATVDSAGVVTGVTPGSAIITATSEGVQGSASVSVEPAVASVTVAILSPLVPAATTTSATAIVRDASNNVLTGQTVTWTSSNPEVATVGFDGAIAAVAAGSTTITATAQEVSGTATLTVTSAASGATQIVVTTQPNGVTTGAAMSPVPTVELRDESNNRVNANILVGVSIATGSGTLFGTVVTTSVGGVASFPDLRINGGGTHTLTFSAVGLSVTSNAFTVSPAVGATQLTITTQPSSTALNGVFFSEQPGIQVRDAANNPVRDDGIVVTASIASGGGTLGGVASATTDVNGVATFANLSISGIAGPRTLVFTSPNLAPATSSLITVNAGAPSALTITTQPPTAAQSGVAFQQQPAVQLRDASSNPVTLAGLIITASIASGNGTLGGNATATTNSNGLATFTSLAIAGSGTQTLQFTASGLASATSTPIGLSSGAPNTLSITTQPSSTAQSGVAFAQQPVIQLLDPLGAALNQSGVVVTASIASGGGSLGGATTATTNASGVATFTNLSISGAVGSRTLTFGATGFSAITSGSIALGSGPASKLIIATQPSATAQVGVPFAQQPAAQLLDAANNTVAQAGVVVTAAIASGGGSIAGTTTATTNASGVATFTNLAINGTPGARTLSFTSSGLTSATSTTVTVSSGPATQLAVTVQPSATSASGVAFGTQPTVRLRDGGGNSVSQSGISITASIGSGTGTLGGTTTLSTDGNGTVTFSNLSISGVAGPYTVRFSSGALTAATTNTITILVPAKLTITSQPSAGQSGLSLSPAPVIQLRDAANTPVAAPGVVVTAAIATGGGTLGGTTAATTNASGAATFSNLTITGTAGVRTLTFSATGLTAATSTDISVTVPPPTVDAEPVFDGSVNTMVYQDNMDQYTSPTTMGATGQTGPRITPNPSPMTTSSSVNTSQNQLITGRDGSGKALRLGFSGGNQTSATYITWNMPSTPKLATHTFQYWARVGFSSPFTGTLAVKWFEAWHASGVDRVQWNTHDHLPCPTTGHSTYWQVYDQSRETTCQGNQPVGPYLTDVTDGQWHRFTYQYRPNSSAGARDGFARMWIDGTKIIDISAATIGVTPAGGDKPWCLADDVDKLAVNDGISNQFWGSTQTTVTPSWTYDIDDYKWWIR